MKKHVDLIISSILFVCCCGFLIFLDKIITHPHQVSEKIYQIVSVIGCVSVMILLLMFIRHSLLKKYPRLNDIAWGMVVGLVMIISAIILLPFAVAYVEYNSDWNWVFVYLGVAIVYLFMYVVVGSSEIKRKDEEERSRKNFWVRRQAAGEISKGNYGLAEQIARENYE